jgi:maltose O-acetyltransferase
MVRRIIESFIFFCFKTAKRVYTKKIYEGYSRKYNLSPPFKFNGESILVYGEGALVVAANSYIGSNSTIQIQKDYHVAIGENAHISHNVRIYTTTNIADQNFNSTNVLESVSKNVKIGNSVWIGANVYINPVINISDNAIIGADSVVTKDIPANAISAGVPAKVIRFKKSNA